ncbi:hypothetical protein VCHENC02_0931B, partial [Vibrio harveyi]
IPNL